MSVTRSTASTMPSSSKPGPVILPEADILRARSAEQQLVILGALLVDAQDADVAGMMMAAGVDAAADLELQLAEVALAPGQAKRVAIFCATGIERALARLQ